MKEIKKILTLVTNKFTDIAESNEAIVELLECKYGIDLKKNSDEVVQSMDKIFKGRNADEEKAKSVAKYFSRFQSNEIKLEVIDEILTLIKEILEDNKPNGRLNLRNMIGEAIVSCEHCGWKIDLNESDTCKICGKSIFLAPDAN